MFLSRMNLKNSNGRDSAANSDYLNKVLCSVGTEGRARTDTPVKEPDFESGASTSFATQAKRPSILPNLIQSYNSRLMLVGKANGRKNKIIGL